MRQVSATESGKSTGCLDSIVILAVHQDCVAGRRAVGLPEARYMFSIMPLQSRWSAHSRQVAQERERRFVCRS